MARTRLEARGWTKNQDKEGPDLIRWGKSRRRGRGRGDRATIYIAEVGGLDQETERRELYVLDT
jgi:hypothetical protein